MMDDETNIVIRTQHLWGVLVAAVGSLLATWKMLFTQKFKKIDALQASIDRVEGKLEDYVKEEDAKLDKVHNRLNDIWEFLARK